MKKYLVMLTYGDSPLSERKRLKKMKLDWEKALLENNPL